MTAVVKTMIQARPVGKGVRLSNIPFQDNRPDAFSTRFQEDFQPVFIKTAEPVPPPISAQVHHRDLRHIKEYLTETKRCYPHHPLPQIARTPGWSMLNTNFKMPTDPEEAAFMTTQAQNYRPQPFQPPPAPIRHTEATKKIQYVKKLPESTYRASFIPYKCLPDEKVTCKHPEEGFPTIKGDRRLHSFATQFNSTFQGAWSPAAKPVQKLSSVVLGDPEKTVEKHTSYAVSFRRPTTCRYRPPVVKEHLKLNLGHFYKDSWLSTTRETFCDHKLGDPVVVTRRDKNSSSLSLGDTDTRLNKVWMSVTTNRMSFSNPNQTKRPVHVSGADLMTKSHMEFGPPCQSGLYYTTTAREHYCKRDGERARPVIHLPCKILWSGPEHKWYYSTTKTDYVPLKATNRQTPHSSQQKSNIRFPLVQQDFSTTYSEMYTTKPFSVPTATDPAADKINKVK